ncbi:MAG: hypothetical protein ACI85O_002164 [Saprospiraceae bacterium]
MLSPFFRLNLRNIINLKMSEFQQYTFRSIDRPLTPMEQKEVSSWSSRTEATAFGAQFTYHYGDFSKNIENCVLNYFDAGTYISNWGVTELVLRFPIAGLDFDDLASFDTTVWESEVKVNQKKKYILVHVRIHNEDGGGYQEEDISIDSLLPIREEILNGDYRALYICWLAAESQKGAMTEEKEEEEREDEWDYDPDNESIIPPIPTGMDKLTLAQRKLALFLDLDKSVLKAVAKLSKPKKKVVEPNYAELLEKMDAAEKDEFLLAILRGDTNLNRTLQRRLKEIGDIKKSEEDDLPRATWQEIYKIL